MELPMIRARLRIKINGPPLCKFKPVSIRKLWIQQGHQYAESATRKKVVIDRIRSEAQQYTSKIFDWISLIYEWGNDSNHCFLRQELLNGDNQKFNLWVKARNAKIVKGVVSLLNLYKNWVLIKFCQESGLKKILNVK